MEDNVYNVVVVVVVVVSRTGKAIRDGGLMENGPSSGAIGREGGTWIEHHPISLSPSPIPEAASFYSFLPRIPQETLLLLSFRFAFFTPRSFFASVSSNSVLTCSFAFSLLFLHAP